MSTTRRSPSKVFYESTNYVENLLVYSRRAEGDGAPAKKRRKLDVTAHVHFDEPISQKEREAISEKRPPHSSPGPPLWSHRFGLPRQLSRRLPCSKRPILESFVSNNQTDVHRIHAHSEDATYSTPFASAFSNGAKAGRNHLVAIATEEGLVDIVDMVPRQPWEYAPQSNCVLVQRNAIFDVKWSNDDTHIVTSSGDHTSIIFDVETRKVKGILAAHRMTVRTTLWDPSSPDLLVSASRDGDIHLWDLRVAAGGQSVYSPICSIVQAHAERPLKGRKATAGLRSVTSINYIPERDHLLLSSGSADGVLKTWDLRQVASEEKKDRSRTSEPWASTHDPTMLKQDKDGNIVSNSIRSRAIASVAVDRTGSVAWGLARNGSIYSYRLNQIYAEGEERDAQVVASCPDPLQHPSLWTNTFYPRLALSPCGSYLAAGSSNGRILLWDTDELLRPRAGTGIRPQDAVVLSGHEAEASSVDWGYDSLLSSGDDCTVRVWRKDPFQARECREAEAVDGMQCGAWGYALRRP